MMERLAFEERHRQVVLAVRFADVEDAHDARVLRARAARRASR